jgi:predicted pyridoxine 5'-phosphate oxidase superfamily flavin-nucleotide-binding protein
MSDTNTVVAAPTPPSGWRAAESPFHDGELAAQERAGVRERMDISARRGIRDYMPEQHRIFFAEQPFMVLGGVDTTGQPWATLRIGAPGFISTPDERTLRIAGRSLEGDPLAGTWQAGSVVGGLGIQPATRRRNRVNGVITAIDDQAMTIAVSQSYGNCAKYIQSRTPTTIEFDAEETSGSPVLSNRLNDADRDLLAHADTFFIASANTSTDAGLGRGADVSHRGGKPGFIRIDDDHTLTTPDFSGNLFFNTIGNLTLDPRAGLLVIDFASGDLLYLAVDAEIIREGKDLESFDGAERLLRWHVRGVRRTRRALPLRWSGVQYAPQLARTGSWLAHG